MRPIWIAAVALIALGCSAPIQEPTQPATFDVTGTFTISRVMLDGIDGDRCNGSDGYDDIETGTQVKVSDASGKIIGLGALKAGLARDTHPDWRGTDKCVFDFEVKAIPEDSGSIYGVEVSHRGVVQFTRDQASDLALTLG